MDPLFIIILALSYCIGSLNSGVIIGQMFYKTDIREMGSNNAGATNMLRSLGPKAAIPVFLLDILKPVLIVLLSRTFLAERFDLIQGSYTWFCFATILGQCYPIFYQFKGGKGAASTLGTLIGGFPWTLPSAVTIFLATVFFTKYVSLATLIAISSTIPIVGIFYTDQIIPFSCIVLLVFWRHRENIKRLITKTENKISLKKQQTKNDR